MRDLNHQLKQLCWRNRDGSQATQRDRVGMLSPIADQTFTREQVTVIYLSKCDAQVTDEPYAINDCNVDLSCYHCNHLNENVWSTAWPISLSGIWISESSMRSNSGPPDTDAAPKPSIARCWKSCCCGPRQRVLRKSSQLCPMSGRMKISSG